MSGPNRSARDLGPNDLIWDFFSRPATQPMIERVEPAAAAGFAAIGMYLGAWNTMRDDASAVEAFDDALAAHGIVVANIEALRGWASPDGPDEACLATESLVWELAARYECRYLQVIGDYHGTVEQAAAGFAALCDRAADHGLLIGLEAVPGMTNIDSLGLANEIVERADRANGGLCFDSWHLTRSTNDIGDILALDGAKIFATQWNDGPLEPVHEDYYTDTLTTRVPPGRGAFKLREMLEAIDAIGSKAPIGLEVPSTELWELPAAEAARIVADDMRSLLRSVRG